MSDFAPLTQRRAHIYTPRVVGLDYRHRFLHSGTNDRSVERQARTIRELYGVAFHGQPVNDPDMFTSCRSGRMAHV